MDDGVDVTPYGAIVSMCMRLISAFPSRGVGAGRGNASDGMSTRTAGYATGSALRASRICVANVCARSADITGGYNADLFPREFPSASKPFAIAA